MLLLQVWLSISCMSKSLKMDTIFTAVPLMWSGRGVCWCLPILNFITISLHVFILIKLHYHLLTLLHFDAKVIFLAPTLQMFHLLSVETKAHYCWRCIQPQLRHLWTSQFGSLEEWQPIMDAVWGLASFCWNRQGLSENHVVWMGAYVVLKAVYTFLNWWYIFRWTEVKSPSYSH